MNGLPLASVLPAALHTTAAERLAALFDAHHERLYRLARRLVPTADDALDLVQDTFLKAARAAGSIPHGASNEEAWLVRVLVNIRRDQWRRAEVRKRYSDTERFDLAATGTEDAIVARADIWSALEALPPRRRAVIVMHELEELSVTGIATLLGISAITVRWHLSRGRRELARILNPQSGERR